MKTTVFFVNLRRFNTLLPLLAILIFAVILAWSFISKSKESPPKSEMPPGQAESLIGDVLELRRIDVDLDFGPKLVMLKVVSKKKSASAYDTSAYDNAEIRNLVFVGDDSEALKWVFPTQMQELVSIHPVKNAGEVIKAVYVEAIDKTSDVKTSDLRRRSIYLIGPDGSEYKKILTDVAEVLSRRNDANTLRLIYQKENSVRMALINLQNFRVLADRELAKMSEFTK